MDLDALKAVVLNTVYEANGFVKLNGFKLLAARHRVSNCGIFVVNGNFGNDELLLCKSEAKAAGIKSTRMYVYGRSSSQTNGRALFASFAEIGILDVA